ncbi:MAG: flagellar hook capping FlgD N-terminal domain-containing protein [Azospirillaceae bacterium]
MDAASALNAAASGDAPASAKASKKVAETFDQFLSMLTTQLKNQDPLSPMDTTEFTNQLVSFTQVEQQIATNKNLESLIGMQPANGVTGALGFLGTEIEAEGSALWFDGSAQEIGYELPADVASARIDLLDATGRPIYGTEVPADAGKGRITWDGATALGGTAEPGLYTIRVTALDGQGEALEAGTRIKGTVTGIETTDGNTTLMIGDLPIAIDKVVAARAPTDAES